MRVLPKFNLKSPLIPLSLVILIDHLGFGIIYPILVPIFMGENSILGLDASDSLKSFWYSVILSVFPFMMFFGATILGTLSDLYGRKKVLMICLLGAFVGYGLSGLAVDLKSISLLIFSRALAGLTAGSMPIAQAAVIDISPESNKAANLGLVILAASLGFLLGPLLGGFFSNSQMVSWFSYSTPLYLSAIVSIINLGMLHFFKETFIPSKKVVFKWSQSFDYIIIPFKVKNIRMLALVLLLMQLGWSFYFQFISVFLLKRYHFTSQDISLFMSLMGIGFAVGSCWILPLISKYYQDATGAFGALLTVTLGVIITVSDIHASLAWITTFFLGIAMSVAYSMLIKLFSNIVSEDEQGWIMGVSEAIAAVAWATTPLVSSYLENFSLYIPLSMAATLLISSTVLIRYWHSVAPRQRTSLLLNNSN